MIDASGVYNLSEEKTVEVQGGKLVVRVLDLQEHATLKVNLASGIVVSDEVTRSVTLQADGERGRPTARAHGAQQRARHHHLRCGRVRDAGAVGSRRPDADANGPRRARAVATGAAGAARAGRAAAAGLGSRGGA